MYDTHFRRRTTASFFTRATIIESNCHARDSHLCQRGARTSNEDPGTPFVSTTTPAGPEGFHWGRALFESFAFLAIEQAYVVHDDYRWVVSENGVPFNHYWRDYKQSLHTWVNAGWDDGDNPLYSYVGHPIQGALTEYIQIQNDPQGAALELANTKAYWRSRSKAFLWNAVYSTLWNIGPLSEVTVEKYGTKVRTPWNKGRHVALHEATLCHWRGTGGPCHDSDRRGVARQRDCSPT